MEFFSHIYGCFPDDKYSNFSCHGHDVIKRFHYYTILVELDDCYDSLLDAIKKRTMIDYDNNEEIHAINKMFNEFYNDIEECILIVRNNFRTHIVNSNILSTSSVTVDPLSIICKYMLDRNRLGPLLHEFPNYIFNYICIYGMLKQKRKKNYNEISFGGYLPSKEGPVTFENRIKSCLYYYFQQNKYKNPELEVNRALKDIKIIYFRFEKDFDLQLTIIYYGMKKILYNVDIISKLKTQMEKLDTLQIVYYQMVRIGNAVNEMDKFLLYIEQTLNNSFVPILFFERKISLNTFLTDVESTQVWTDDILWTFNEWRNYAAHNFKSNYGEFYSGTKIPKLKPLKEIFQYIPELLKKLEKYKPHMNLEKFYAGQFSELDNLS